jgi:hypothetical protein
MDRSTTHYGESPPQTRRIVAGDAEVVSMKIQQRSGIRILSWTGAALMLAFLGGAPREAEARFHRPSEPPFPEGDPEADDQPSPTPKQSRNYSESTVRGNGLESTVRRDGRDFVRKGVGSHERLIWLYYVRVWIRINLL